SAVLMPIRIVEQDASAWEALIALTLLLAFTLVTILVGERLYRRSLLQSGGRVGLRAAWSAPE
ncbi:MAG: ABC transporter permease, partial [Thermoleophilia bacterium]|nr:ABC transporter permease [Thermoleophilia bacterium]